MTATLAHLALSRGMPDTRLRATIAADGALYHWPFDEGVGNWLPVSGSTPAAVPSGINTHRALDRWGDYACTSFSGANGILTGALTLGSPTRMVTQVLCYFPAYGAAAFREVFEYGSPTTWFSVAGGQVFAYDGGVNGTTAKGFIGLTDGATLTYAEVPRPPVGWCLITMVVNTALSGIARLDVYYDGVVQAKTNTTVGANSGTAISNAAMSFGYRAPGSTFYSASGVKIAHAQIYTGAGFTPQRILEHARHAQPSLVDTRTQQTILCVGDSITTGYSVALGYPSRLIGLLRKRGYRKIVTLGTIAGSYDGRETWRNHEGHGGQGTDYFAAHPELLVGADVAIVMLGMNDLGGGFAFDLTAAQWVANLVIIRDALVSAGTKKVMIVVPHRGYPSGGASPLSTANLTRVGEYYAAASALTDSRTVVCYGVYDNVDASTMRQDNPHLNDAGDDTAAQAIHDCGVTNGYW